MTNKKFNKSANTAINIDAYPIINVLIPVNWGLWNTIASILSIVSTINENVIWITLILLGLICNFIIFAYAKKKKGYEPVKISSSKWLLITIIIAIIELCFILPAIVPFYDMKFRIVLVTLLIGIRITVVGKTVEIRALMLIGLVWIMTTNLMIYQIKYRFHIYALLCIITLIIIPVTRYIFIKLRNTDG